MTKTIRERLATIEIKLKIIEKLMYGVIIILVGGKGIETFIYIVGWL